MRDRMCKKYQHKLNKKLRELNTSIEHDNLWLGRFYAKQMRYYWYKFEDGSGGILSVIIRMYDKKTNDYKDYRLEYTPYYKTINWKISMDIANDFVVEYLKVWENENPRNEIQDWRGVAKIQNDNRELKFY